MELGLELRIPCEEAETGQQLEVNIGADPVDRFLYKMGRPKHKFPLGGPDAVLSILLMEEVEHVNALRRRIVSSLLLHAKMAYNGKDFKMHSTATKANRKRYIRT